MRFYLGKNFRLENIKVVAFDFDETFYSSSNMKELYLKYIENTFQKLCGFSLDKTKEIMKSLGYDLKSKTAPSFSQICTDFGVSEEKYHNYRIKNFFEIDYNSAEKIEESVLAIYKNRFKLYIVSNEIDEIFYKKFNKLGFNKTYFEGIYVTPKDAKGTKRKDIPYLDIIHNENIDSNELLVVGDRFKVDIEPAIDIGANGILIDKPSDIKEILDKLKT